MLPIRLDKRLAELLGCPRGEARRYIEGGWVRVDGEVVEQPQAAVTTQSIEVDPAARDERAERVSMLLQKPSGMPADALCAQVTPASRSPLDASGMRPLQRHFHGLQLAASLPAQDSGLVVVSQDPRILAHLQQQLSRTEQEFLVDVQGERALWDIARLQAGLQENGRTLGGCRISWQSEQRLRFAGKGLHPRMLRDACTGASMQVVGIRRLRIGRVALGPLLPGQWRYMGVDERF